MFAENIARLSISDATQIHVNRLCGGVKMTKFHRLDAMRQARDRREAEIINPVLKPVMSALDKAHRTIIRQQDNIDQLTVVVKSKVAPAIYESMAARASQEMYAAISRALQGYGEGADAVVTIPRDALRMLSPSQIEDAVLRRYRDQSRQMRVSAFPRLNDAVTTLDITVPQVSVRVAVADTALESRMRV